MRKTKQKAKKPSEMGLHSKARYVIYPQGSTRAEQAKDIIHQAVDLYDKVKSVFSPKEVVITHRFARYLSLTVTFYGFTEEDVFSILVREVKRRRRIMR